MPKHGISMHGEPKLPADFSHFPYADPDAKKGGTLSFGVVGNFNNTNPFILKGMRTTARGIWDPQFGNLVYETLLSRSKDEPFSLYGLLAERVTLPDDRGWMEFHLNPMAKWSDGQPVLPEDVKFSFEILRDKGRPPYSSRMKKISNIEITGQHSVKFTFNEESDREFPLLVAMTPILPKHAIDPETFDQSTLDIPIGSGPYTVKSIEPGKRIVFEKNAEYWGKGVPSKVGLNNAQEIRIEYFLQVSSLFDAFRKGIVDVYFEGDPSHWQRAYDFPAVKDGRVIKDVFNSDKPANMLSFVFNTRRKVFADPEVRAALARMFDFEWANKNLFFGTYKRTKSFWDGSVLSAFGHPANELEKELLAKHGATIPDDILNGTWKPPVTNGSGRDRKIMRKTYEKLLELGFTYSDNVLRQPNGTPMSFEILIKDREEEKLAIAFSRTLKRIGVDVRVRMVDDSQYQSRSQTWDYDMRLATYSASLSPGGEQIGRWGSPSRDVEGSFNYAGVSSPAIDGIIDEVTSARSEEAFVASVRALDRLLLAGQYVVPLFHIDEQWIGHWAKIKRPDYTALYGAQVESWWVDEAQ